MLVVFTCKLSLKNTLFPNLDRLMRSAREHKAAKSGVLYNFKESEIFILPPDQ